MATKRKAPVTEEAKEEAFEPEELQELEQEMLEGSDDKDAEIARLRAEIDAMKSRMPANVSSDKELVRRLAEQAAADGVDPWSIKVKIRVPRRPEKEDPWYWCNVNDLSVQIPANDKVQELKLPWAEVLLGQLKAEDDVRDYTDNVQVYDPLTNPHPVD